MKEIVIRDSVLSKAASEGMDAFIGAFVDAIYEAIGGELNAETMAELNSDQITLLGYHILHDEVMDGGFVQLIHNGYGPFFFRNPFAKAVQQWGMEDLKRLIRKAHSLYNKYGVELERECTDDEFMALFETHPEFDELDDTFVENEEDWTEMVATYIDDHLERFALIDFDTLEAEDVDTSSPS
ncbi:MAG: DMP19 family protein [Prevotella sp.]|nr:DMP19 family protein [Prevotella sp.]